MVISILATVSVGFLLWGVFLLKKGSLVLGLRVGSLGFILLATTDGVQLFHGEAMGTKGTMMVVLSGFLSFLFLATSFFVQDRVRNNKD